MFLQVLKKTYPILLEFSKNSLQYANKKRYEGRTSLDKRNQRPVLIGRQSQDGRQYGSRVGEPSRDQKARAAGAANLVANTASRKNQTLNSVCC